MSNALDKLFATIAARKGSDPSQSYTAKLLAQGVEKCAKKFGEEATEAVIAAVQKDKTELAKESLKTGKGILELIREQHLLTEDQIQKLLDPAAMTGQKQ